MRRTRASLAMTFVCFLIVIIAISMSADAPVDRYVKHDRSVGRGIALYLGASGSTLPYDSKIGGAFRGTISHFEDEGISLQPWNTYLITMFPLTDDYEIATDVLQDMSDTIGIDLVRIGGRSSATQELLGYLAPAMDGNQEVPSIVGDGLASCVVGFDRNDRQCSRTILLATDNEVYGDGAYNLSETIRFVKGQGVTVTALYPGSDITLSSETLQLCDKVCKTGGDLHDASSPSSMDRVMEQIEVEQKKELDSTDKMLETDRPDAALGWTLFDVVPLLGLSAFGKF